MNVADSCEPTPLIKPIEPTHRVSGLGFGRYRSSPGGSHSGDPLLSTAETSRRCRLIADRVTITQKWPAPPLESCRFVSMDATTKPFFLSRQSSLSHSRAVQGLPVDEALCHDLLRALHEEHELYVHPERWKRRWLVAILGTLPPKWSPPPPECGRFV